MSLPLYRITIDPEYSDGEDLGITAIAFTSQPAIKVKGMNFTTETELEKKLFFGDKLKNRIVAPIMIPMDIYRSDEFSEYYVQFTENEIERMHSKFMKNFTNRKIFNLEHNDENKVNAYVLETWIVDSPEQDKSFSTYGIKVPQGSVMMVAQIGDSQTYNELVANEQLGFSVEGFMGLSLSELINKKLNKEEKMSEQKFEMKLPPGEYKQGDKTYVVAEDGSVTIKDEAKMAKDDNLDAIVPEDKLPKDETVGGDATDEEKKKEQLADEVPPAAEGSTDTYSKAEVDAKFDEIMQIIAEMQAEEIGEDVPQLPTQMSKSNKFSEDVNFKINRINAFLNKK